MQETEEVRLRRGPVRDALTLWRARDSRVRHGRSAGILFVLAAAYGAVVLPTVPQVYVGVQLALVLGAALGGLTCWFLPWQRWPPSVTLVPAAVGAIMLTVGSAGIAGVLEHYIACIAALFAYLGLTQSPRLRCWWAWGPRPLWSVPSCSASRTRTSSSCSPRSLSWPAWAP